MKKKIVFLLVCVLLVMCACIVAHADSEPAASVTLRYRVYDNVNIFDWIHYEYKTTDYTAFAGAYDLTICTP